MKYTKEYRDRDTGNVFASYEIDTDKVFVFNSDNKFLENRFTEEEFNDLNLMPKHLFDVIFKEANGFNFYYDDEGNERLHKPFRISEGCQDSVLSYNLGFMEKFYPH